jgi:hypothetical protein
MNKPRIVAAFLLLAFATVAWAQTSSKDDAELGALVRQMATYQVTFDPAGLDKIFTSDYIEISPAGEFDPREKVLGFYKAENKPGTSAIPAIEVSELSIRNYGKFAIVIAKLTYAVSPTVPSRSMRGTFVCRREKNSWKIASSQYTGIRPPPPKT